MDDSTLSADGLKAWAKATGERPAERHANRVASLPDGERVGTAKHPFPVADREVYLAQTRGKGIAELSHKAPVGRVRLDALQGIQRTINRERLVMHLNDPRLVPTGARAASGSGMASDLPVVVKLNGKHYVHDGHHRLAAAHLRGESNARVRLIDLDEGGKR